MIPVIFILLNFAKSELPDCPDWDCSDLDWGVCAQIKDNQIHLNEDGCDPENDEYCSIDTISNWYAAQKSNGVMYPCDRKITVIDIDEEMKVEFDDLDDYLRKQLETDHPCGTKDTDQELEEGQHPKQCNYNSDCRTREGGDSLCVCGLDGDYWCKAEWGSSWFDDFWDECDSGDGQVSQDFWKYWEAKYNNYIYVISAPSCAKYMDELHEVEHLEDEADDFALLTLLYFLLIFV